LLTQFLLVDCSHNLQIQSSELERPPYEDSPWPSLLKHFMFLCQPQVV